MPRQRLWDVAFLPPMSRTSTAYPPHFLLSMATVHPLACHQCAAASLRPYHGASQRPCRQGHAHHPAWRPLSCRRRSPRTRPLVPLPLGLPAHRCDCDRTHCRPLCI